MSNQIVAYYRVSTQKQGRSGLGLEAQQAAVQAFAQANNLTIVATFTEVETAKGTDAIERRPQLAAALKTAKKRKCAVVVAKLDRLSRDVAFISGLMSQKVPFICCDLGQGRQPVHAAHLRRARRAGAPDDQRAHQGRDAGCRSSAASPSATRNSVKPTSNAAAERAAALQPILAEAVRPVSRCRARELNARQVATPTGAPWSAKTVIRVRDRVAA